MVLGILMSSRSTETVSSVRRSCFEALGDKERVFKTAVLRSRGVLGSRIFASVTGLRSMVREAGRMWEQSVASGGIVAN